MLGTPWSPLPRTSGSWQVRNRPLPAPPPPRCPLPALPVPKGHPGLGTRLQGSVCFGTLGVGMRPPVRLGRLPTPLGSSRVPLGSSGSSRLLWRLQSPSVPPKSSQLPHLPLVLPSSSPALPSSPPVPSGFCSARSSLSSNSHPGSVGRSKSRDSQIPSSSFHPGGVWDLSNSGIHQP